MHSVRMQVLPTASLPDETRSELWDFTSRFVETDRQNWELKLDAHAQVILYRERGSGGLMGMAAMDFQEVTHEGRQNLLHRTGLRGRRAQGG